jgi:hypothetical protein
MSAITRPPAAASATGVRAYLSSKLPRPAVVMHMYVYTMCEQYSVSDKRLFQWFLQHPTSATTIAVLLLLLQQLLLSQQASTTVMLLLLLLPKLPRP